MDNRPGRTTWYEWAVLMVLLAMIVVLWLNGPIANRAPF
jgi:hypothetical protein